MQIFYCSQCRTRVTSLDIDKGDAIKAEDGCLCRACARSLNLIDKKSTRGAAAPDLKALRDFEKTAVATHRQTRMSTAPAPQKSILFLLVAIVGILVLVTAVLMARHLNRKSGNEIVNPVVRETGPVVDTVEKPLPSEPDPVRVPALADNFPAADGWMSLLGESWKRSWVKRNGSWSGREQSLTGIARPGMPAVIESLAPWKDFELALTLKIDGPTAINMGFREKERLAGRITLKSLVPDVWHTVVLKVQGKAVTGLKVDGRDITDEDETVGFEVNRFDSVEGKITIGINGSGGRDTEITVAEAEGRTPAVLKTLPVLAVSDAAVSRLSDSEAVVTWTTTRPSIGKVEYSDAAAFGIRPGEVPVVYYQGRELQIPYVRRMHKSIDCDYGDNGPDPEVPADYFSARWEGFIKAGTAGVYTFYVTSDDGARLWVNDRLIVDAWIDQAPTEYQGTINLAEGWNPFKLEYFEGNVSAFIRLEYSSNVMPRQVISADCLGSTVFDASTTPEPVTVTRHSRKLIGLLPGTTYRCRIICSDPSTQIATLDGVEYQHQ